MTWEQFIKFNAPTELDALAIKYGLKEQGILEEFLEEWNGRWLLDTPERVIDSCLMWSHTRKGQEFWREHNATFKTYFKVYKTRCLKKPSIYRSVK